MDGTNLSQDCAGAAPSLQQQRCVGAAAAATSGWAPSSSGDDSGSIGGALRASQQEQEPEFLAVCQKDVREMGRSTTMPAVLRITRRAVLGVTRWRKNDEVAAVVGGTQSGVAC